MPRVHPLKRYDARIAGDRLMQLAVPGIDANDPGSATCQKNMGEAAGRSADIETEMSGGIEAEGYESCSQLDTAARDPRIGRRGFDHSVRTNRRRRFADDFPIGTHESGRNGFLRLGSARKKLAPNQRDIGARVRSEFFCHGLCSSDWSGAATGLTPLAS